MRLQLPPVRKTVIAAALGISSVFMYAGGNPFKDAAKRVATIKPNPRITSKQAELIASLYFELEFGGCGGPAEAEDNPTHWAFRSFIGVGGSPGPKITVDKNSGMVSSDSGRTYDSPFALSKAALTPRSTRSQP